MGRCSPGHSSGDHTYDSSLVPGLNFDGSGTNLLEGKNTPRILGGAVGLHLCNAFFPRAANPDPLAADIAPQGLAGALLFGNNPSELLGMMHLTEVSVRLSDHDGLFQRQPTPCHCMRLRSPKTMNVLEMMGTKEGHLQKPQVVRNIHYA